MSRQPEVTRTNEQKLDELALEFLVTHARTNQTLTFNPTARHKGKIDPLDQIKWGENELFESLSAFAKNNGVFPLIPLSPEEQAKPSLLTSTDQADQTKKLERFILNHINPMHDFRRALIDEANKQASGFVFDSSKGSKLKSTDIQIHENMVEINPNVATEFFKQLMVSATSQMEFPSNSDREKLIGSAVNHLIEEYFFFQLSQRSKGGLSPTTKDGAEVKLVEVARSIKEATVDKELEGFDLMTDLKAPQPPTSSNTQGFFKALGEKLRRIQDNKMPDPGGTEMKKLPPKK